MNRWQNGEVRVGAPGSYQNLLSALRDLLRGSPKDFEVFHLRQKFIAEAKRIGKPEAEMQRDWAVAHLTGRVVMVEGAFRGKKS